jgi:hypothetical protein
MTVQNAVHVLWINLHKLSKLCSSFLNILYAITTIVVHCTWFYWLTFILLLAENLIIKTIIHKSVCACMRECVCLCECNFLLVFSQLLFPRAVRKKSELALMFSVGVMWIVFMELCILIKENQETFDEVALVSKDFGTNGSVKQCLYSNKLKNPSIQCISFCLNEPHECNMLLSEGII